MKTAIWFTRIVCMISFVIAILIIISGEYDDSVNIALIFYCLIVILTFGFSFNLEYEYEGLVDDVYLYSQEIDRLKRINELNKNKR